MRAHGRGRLAEQATERAVEMGDVRESYAERDVGDPRTAIGVLQQRIGRPQPQLTQMLGEGLSGSFEQPLKVARRDADARCHDGDAEIRLAEPLRDDVLCRAQRLGSEGGTSEPEAVGQVVWGVPLEKST